MHFEEFVTERLDALLRYATALCCDPHLAQDVVQDVMLRAQVRWPRISATGNESAYVKRMVTNEYLSWRRRRASRDIALSHGVLDAVSPSTEDPAVRYDERDAMLHAIAQLPRRQRVAVVLRYYDNCTDDEIATTMGCGAGTVRSHISRALGTLRAFQPARERL